MLDCSNCSNWFHGNCVGIDENDEESIDNFKCERCKRIELTNEIECSKCLEKIDGKSHGNDKIITCISCYPKSLNVRF